jgi:hypothetical protein
MVPQVQAQDPETRHWPLQKISFPVDVDRLASLNPKPTKLRFYAATPGGKFEMISERRIDDLEEIVDQGSRAVRRGFNYTSRADGTEEFALQYVFPNNDVSPTNAKLSAQYRIVFDTRAPLVRLSATAATSVEWVIEDDHLIGDSVRLEVKYPEHAKWTPVGVRAFGTRDRYTWSNIPPGKILEVRITARDRAGHEGVSQVVQLPATNTGRLRNPSDSGLEPPPRPRSGFGNPEENKELAPQIEYVNTNKLIVRSKFTRVTRSGIDAAVLWVNDGKTGWKEDKKKSALGITTATKDPQVEMTYEAPKDGLYGFIVAPINGAGGKPEDPREGDPAQWLVEVDTVPPQVDVRVVRVAPGGLAGPRVEVEWTATDKNMMPEPITIEYQDAEAKNAEWKPIAIKIPNTGRYVWEVEDKALWKFKVRVMAVDKASNSNRAEYKDFVLVDLEKPAAVIEKVQGSGAPVIRNYSPQSQGSTTPKVETIPASNKVMETPAPQPLTITPHPNLPADVKPEPKTAPLPITPIEPIKTPTQTPVSPPGAVPLPTNPSMPLAIPPAGTAPPAVVPLPQPGPQPAPSPIPAVPAVPAAPGNLLPLPELPK